MIHICCKSEITVTSSWYNPLPSENFTSEQVVVCCYRDRWIPILLYPLKDAIALREKAQSFGKDLYICPVSGFQRRELAWL